jgi:hypothetical protein
MTYATLTDARKELSRRDFQKIHERAVEAARGLKKQEAEMIRAIQAVDRCRVYRYIGYGSIFTYVVSALGLSEHQALAYISVARKATELPALQQAIESGEISVNKARRLTAVIDERNQQRWIEIASHSTHRELEKQVAEANPRAALAESARYVNGWLLELQTPISEENFKLLKRVQELMRDKAKATVSIEETLRDLCTDYLDRKDPVRKAQRTVERAQRRAEKSQSNSAEQLGTCPMLLH